MDTDRYTPDLPGLPADRLATRRAALLTELNRIGQRRNVADRPRMAEWWRRVASGRRLVIAGVGVAAAVTAIVTTTFVGRTGPAYASWTATPVAAPPAAVASLVDACTERLAGQFAKRGAPIPDRLVVAERRGGFTAVVLDGRAGHGICLRMPDRQVIGGTGGAERRSTGRYVTIVEGPTVLYQNEGGASVLGQVDAAVTGVVITTFDGRQVTASVSNGWYFAWWPLSERGFEHTSTRLITATGSGGRLLEQVDLGVPSGPASAVPAGSGSPPGRK